MSDILRVLYICMGFIVTSAIITGLDKHRKLSKMLIGVSFLFAPVVLCVGTVYAIILIIVQFINIII